MSEEGQDTGPVTFPLSSKGKMLVDSQDKEVVDVVNEEDVEMILSAINTGILVLHAANFDMVDVIRQLWEAAQKEDEMLAQGGLN